MWQLYALMTVAFWGVYGVLLHTGRAGMLSSPEGTMDASNASMKAFLLVGVAYFVVAVAGPLLWLYFKKSNWAFTGAGIKWSFIAGVAGALGAFALVVSLGAAARGGASPAGVMSIVFGGAPIINAFTAMLVHPPEGGIKAVPGPFWLGILLAALGGFIVAKYNPTAQKPASAPTQHAKH